MTTVIEKRVTLEVHSQLVRQKLNDGLDARGIPEGEYLIQDGEAATFKVPLDLYDMIRTNSDFREGIDYKVIGRKPRVPKASQVRKPRPTLKQMVARGFVEPARRNLRTPTA